MAKVKVTREEVLEFVSKRLGITVEELSDEIPIKDCPAFCFSCTLKFWENVSFNDLHNFTVGDLVRQLVK